MSLTLQILHIPEGELLAETLYTIPETGGLIGRAPECTVPLPDNSKVLSSRHARLFREGNQWLIEDLSINGLFINQSESPLGSSRRHTLVDSDILTCGEYQIMINLFAPDRDSPTQKTFADFTQIPATGDDPFSKTSQQPVREEIVLNDPFDSFPRTAESAVEDNIEPVINPVNTAAITPLSEENHSHHASSQNHTPLIDVLERPEQEQTLDSFVATQTTSIRLSPQSQNPVQTVPARPTAQEKDTQVPSYNHNQQSELQLLRLENQRLQSQLKKRTRLQKKMIVHCMEEALEQTLRDFSPEYLERLFDDYTGNTKRWLRKRDNWQLYTRHFQRMMKEQTVRVAFTARFQSAMASLQEKEN